MMMPRNSLITVLLMIFAVSNFFYRFWDVYFRRYGQQGKVYYGWTLTGLAILHTMIGILSIVEYFVRRDSYNAILGVSAFFIFLMGQILRNWAIISLGEFHSQQIEIKPHHRFIKKGPYAFMRHPYYLGAIFEVLSIPLIFNSFYTFIFSCCGYIPMVGLRIILEEKVMKPFCDQRREPL